MVHIEQVKKYKNKTSFGSKWGPEKKFKAFLVFCMQKNFSKRIKLRGGQNNYQYFSFLDSPYPISLLKEEVNLHQNLSIEQNFN